MSRPPSSGERPSLEFRADHVTAAASRQLAKNRCIDVLHNWARRSISEGKHTRILVRAAKAEELQREWDFGDVRILVAVPRVGKRRVGNLPVGVEIEPVVPETRAAARS